MLEGRIPLSKTRLLILVPPVPTRGRGATAALLGSALESLIKDGVVHPDAALGWGETAAVALAAAGAIARVLVLPSGRLGDPLADDEAAALGTLPYGDEAGRSLATLGAAAADVLVAPSPSAAQALDADRAIATRAADQPLVALRFGCDDPPNDPATDPALPATFSAAAPGGKADNRKALARRASLALGPRTLLLGLAPLRADRGADALLAALPRLCAHDAAILVPGASDRDCLDRVRPLSIEHPGRLAVVGEAGDEASDLRRLRAGADAILLADPDDRTGRAAGLALAYGALPIAPDTGACRDHLVDFDPASATGTAILYPAGDVFEIEAAVRRAISLRHDADVFAALPRTLMLDAPAWGATANALTGLLPG